MTLCIARKINEIPHLASESRFTLGSQFIDFGIKVFSLPVKLWHPTENGITCYKEFSIGMCVAGNTTNAYIVKEAIYEILQNLQFASGYADISIDSICTVINKVFQKVTRDICEIMGKEWASGIIITGNCPDTNQYKTFQFTINASIYPLTTEFHEILVNDDIEFMGSAKTIAKKIYQKNKNWNSLKIIREAINTAEDNKIGGGLQYGEFDKDKNFVIRGVQDYELNDEGIPQYKSTLRGIELYKDEFETSIDNFLIAYTFVMPFESEIDKVWKKLGY